MFALLWKELFGVNLKLPFLIMDYKDVMQRYGSDKPDLRFDMELKEISPIVKILQNIQRAENLQPSKI